MSPPLIIRCALPPWLVAKPPNKVVVSHLRTHTGCLRRTRHSCPAHQTRSTAQLPAVVSCSTGPGHPLPPLDLHTHRRHPRPDPHRSIGPAHPPAHCPDSTALSLRPSTPCSTRPPRPQPHPHTGQRWRVAAGGWSSPDPPTQGHTHTHPFETHTPSGCPRQCWDSHWVCCRGKGWTAHRSRWPGVWPLPRLHWRTWSRGVSRHCWLPGTTRVGCVRQWHCMGAGQGLLVGTLSKDPQPTSRLRPGTGSDCRTGTGRVAASTAHAWVRHCTCMGASRHMWAGVEFGTAQPAALCNGRCTRLP
jgi:hypothetical protein